MKKADALAPRKRLASARAAVKNFPRYLVLLKNRRLNVLRADRHLVNAPF